RINKKMRNYDTYIFFKNSIIFKLFFYIFTKNIISPRSASNADNREFFINISILMKTINGREQFAFCKITCCPEYNNNCFWFMLINHGHVHLIWYEDNVVSESIML